MAFSQPAPAHERQPTYLGSKPGRPNSAEGDFRDAFAPGCSKAENFPGVPDDTIVLVIDDDKVLREVICKALKRAGYYACGLPTAKDALEFLSHRRSGRTILLSDLVLAGGEGGWSLAHQVRQLFPNVPIVLMSGYIDEPAVHALTAAGNVLFLPKPFEIAGLLATINNLRGTMASAAP